jgi:hypothetical protein
MEVAKNPGVQTGAGKQVVDEVELLGASAFLTDRSGPTEERHQRVLAGDDRRRIGCAHHASIHDGVDQAGLGVVDGAHDRPLDLVGEAHDLVVLTNDQLLLRLGIPHHAANLRVHVADGQEAGAGAELEVLRSVLEELPDLVGLDAGDDLHEGNVLHQSAVEGDQAVEAVFAALDVANRRHVVADDLAVLLDQDPTLEAELRERDGGGGLAVVALLNVERVERGVHLVEGRVEHGIEFDDVLRQEDHSLLAVELRDEVVHDLRLAVTLREFRRVELELAGLLVVAVPGELVAVDGCELRELLVVADGDIEGGEGEERDDLGHGKYPCLGCRLLVVLLCSQICLRGSDIIQLRTLKDREL